MVVGWFSWHSDGEGKPRSQGNGTKNRVDNFKKTSYHDVNQKKGFSLLGDIHRPDSQAVENVMAFDEFRFSQI